MSSTAPKPANWSSPSEERVIVADATVLQPAKRIERPAPPRVFPEPIDVPAMVKRVMAERLEWDAAMRVAYQREVRKAMDSLVTNEQRELGYKRRMEMDCPECGQNKQPAGHNCWRCNLPILPMEWYDRKERYPGKKMTPEQREAAIARLARGRAKQNAKAADAPKTKRSKSSTKRASKRA